MAANDKQPMLEPINSKTKDALATFYMILGILAWMIGIILTAFAVLAFLEIGPFADYFNALLDEGVNIPVIVGMGLGTLFSGLFLLTMAKLIRLLKKISTTSYSIRNLETVVPKVINVGGAKEEKKEKEAPKTEHVPHNLHPTQGANNGAVSITFNVQGAMNPEAVAIPAEEDVPALPDKEQKD